MCGTQTPLAIASSWSAGVRGGEMISMSACIRAGKSDGRFWRLCSRARQTRKDHQINVTPRRMAPFPEFFRQGMVLMNQGLRFKILQPLMHQVEGVVDQFGGLFRSHGDESPIMKESNDLDSFEKFFNRPEVGAVAPDTGLCAGAEMRTGWARQAMAGA